MRYYLAHNIEDRHTIRGFENFVEMISDDELYNPFYDSERDDIKEIDAGLKNRFDLTDEEAHEIVECDLKELEKSDGLISVIYKPSIGTIFEIAQAHKLGKKIIIITKPYKNHPFLRVFADEIFETIDEFITEKYINKRTGVKNMEKNEKLAWFTRGFYCEAHVSIEDMAHTEKLFEQVEAQLDDYERGGRFA